ncbi:hypothetical protein TOPH_07837 [Tolypocladium ophioglossoides CBS 100239]|uniref:Sialidase n=1 Tax=Tolypocladium ophioglossoides (strain CBS 100239) TaxID=1163406 RepID=A0A0L0N0L3_TOLOC|nr:hypothetical protein TOPH_07837 [Tolypocladium ophioglossoides CBS 100239]
MSALEADVAFDLAFASSTTPPPAYGFAMDGSFSFDPSLLDMPYQSRRHARSSSKASSVYSAVSTVESTPDSVSTRLSTPPRASPPVRHHGPLLLPKIRSQDQDIDLAQVSAAAAGLRRARKTHSNSTPPPAASRPFHSGHARSYTNPETLSGMAYAHMSSFTGHAIEDQHAASAAVAPLLCSPASFAHDSFPTEPEVMMPDGLPSRRASTCGSLDAATVDRFGYPTYRQMPFVPASTAPSTQSDFSFSPYAPRAPSPLSLASSSDETSMSMSTPSTTLINFLTAPNPAASLVRTISFPLRDPSIKHFWWDVRSIRAWTSFNAAAVLALPRASDLLTTPVPAPVLPHPAMPSRHPETEAALHAIYAAYYLPKLNAALAISSARPLQLSVPAQTPQASSTNQLLFVANAAGESSTAAAMFGGKPSARVVGLVRSFDRFNTGMRVEGNVKRVEYLRGLAALHHAMREHGCRYGFILTEIELVVVRNGADPTPYFGDLDIASVQLAGSSSAGSAGTNEPSPLTACLALWGLCQLAGDAAAGSGHAPWRAEIGAPAEGTRRKARPRDSWMPQPQLAEKREAKRSRGWVWPEDAIGRKELGKRGVKYGGV